MIYVGIDPGTKGAISFIDDERKVLRSRELTYSSGLDTNLFFWDFKELAEINMNKPLEKTIVGDLIPFVVMIEEPIAMPEQNVKGLRSSYTNYGRMLAVFELFSIPYQEIRPNIWKKEFSLIKKDKKVSVEVAKKLFPSINFYTERNRMMDGKAESLLLAEYCRRKYIYVAQSIGKDNIGDVNSNRR